MGERLGQLSRWVEGQASALGLRLQSTELEPVSGDASFRRYFRARGMAQSWIAVDAPPEHEDSSPFVRIATAWARQGIRVPQLLAVDLQQGFMLQQDFGDRQLLAELRPQAAHALYAVALDELVRIQQSDPQPLPPYDEALLRREMGLFDEWFVARLLGLTLSAGERALLAEVEAELVASALAQRQVSVHRDYHSRNLMLLNDGSLGVIDFQDAVVGALTYDLVSLLRDSYVRWPDEQVAQWVEAHRQRVLALGWELPAEAEFLRQFDLMGMQRQLKVLGIFARLWLRDGKAGYLADIPRTLGYLYRAAGRYPQFEPLQQFLTERVVPALQQHALYREINLASEL